MNGICDAFALYVLLGSAENGLAAKRYRKEEVMVYFKTQERRSEAGRKKEYCRPTAKCKKGNQLNFSTMANHEE